MLFQLATVALLCTVVLAHPLDDYVAIVDESYGYTYLGSFEDEVRGVTVHHLNMTSQTWQSDDVSTATEWFHYMGVVVPYELSSNSNYGTLFVSEGHQTDGPPTEENDLYLPLVMDMASQSGLITTILNQVPNQPVLFHDDEKMMQRSEDDMIAYTIRKFIDDGYVDNTLLALFPMAKAAIRAMDTVQDFASNDLSVDIEKFAMAGASKRGWTTFLASATDPKDRIIASVPIVFTVLNFAENLMDHYQCLGGWSWAMGPYYNEDLSGGVASDFMDNYAYLVDPYAFIDRMTFPKLIIVATGDEFFFPHESKNFFDDLPGQTHFLMIENTNHFLIGHHARLVRNIVTFVTATIENHALPAMSWEKTISEDGLTGKLTFSADQTPTQVTRWTSTTTSLTGQRRDYRMLVRADFGVGLIPNPIMWFASSVEPNVDGVYEVEYDVPESGYRGFFMTAEFEANNGNVFEATTEVHNLPDTFPFEECLTVAECKGELK